MPIDASIPFRASQAGQFNLGELYGQQQQMQQRQQAMDFQRQQFDAQQRAAELKRLDDLDENKRKAVEAGVKDMAAAVQWADTREKWKVVQDHYAQFDPHVASVPFEHREEALISLGHMADYLKNTAPKIQAIEAGGSLAAVDPQTGRPTFTVLPNPGGMQPGSPAGGGVQEGATATNPQTGEKLMYRGGQWVPVHGGPQVAPAAGFPGAGG